MMPAAHFLTDARKTMPYLTGMAANIVDQGDSDSYPHLNQLSQGIMRDPERSHAMFWALLVASVECRDQNLFDAWQNRESGMFFEVILRLFTLAKPVLMRDRDADPYASTISEVIEQASSTSEPWTTLSQLTVAVLEVTDRGSLETWMYRTS